MPQDILIVENGLDLVLRITDDLDVRLLHCSALPFQQMAEQEQTVKRLVELQVTGENQDDHHGARHTGTLPGKRLRYVAHSWLETVHGRKLEIKQQDEPTGLQVISHLQFYSGLACLSAWTSVTNMGTVPQGLEYVSSFALTGLMPGGLLPWDERTALSMAHNTWQGELQWQTNTLPELGLHKVNRKAAVNRLAYSSTGTWSSSQYLPMGYLEDREIGAGLIWQIEHNGSWHWEIGEQEQQLYLQLSGPTEQENHWWKSLQPGETFDSVPVAVGCVATQGKTSTGFTQAIRLFTEYRRRIRRPNADNRVLPVIFNDFVVLWAEPTEEKELPLIEAAAEAGCEYYCIDAGWYSGGGFWENVGDWHPSEQRFPDGLPRLLEKIREAGIIPGLWLELEVMGMDLPLARELPDAWFFCRHGKRIIDHGRYQLDYRHPSVRAFADEVVDRLI